VAESPIVEAESPIVMAEFPSRYHNGYLIGKFTHYTGKYRHHNGDYIRKFSSATILGDPDNTMGTALGNLTTTFGDTDNTMGKFSYHIGRSRHHNGDHVLSWINGLLDIENYVIPQ
jgi:hypothetical protein